MSESCTKTLLTFNTVLSIALQMNECNRLRKDERQNREQTEKRKINSLSSQPHPPESQDVNLKG